MITVVGKARMIQITPDTDSTSRALTLEHLTSYLSIPLDLLFLFLISPFRLTRDFDGSGCFLAKRYWMHRFLCGCVTLIDCLWMIGFIRSSLYTIPRGNTNPALFIQLLKTTITQACKIALLKKLWLESHHFVNLASLILKQFTSGNFQHFKPKWYQGAYTVWVLSFIYTMVGFICAADPSTLGPGIPSDVIITWKVWWGDMMNGARKIFFLEDILSPANFTSVWLSSDLNVSALDKSLRVIAAIGRLHR